MKGAVQSELLRIWYLPLFGGTTSAEGLYVDNE